MPTLEGAQITGKAQRALTRGLRRPRLSPSSGPGLPLETAGHSVTRTPIATSGLFTSWGEVSVACHHEPPSCWTAQPQVDPGGGWRTAAVGREGPRGKAPGSPSSRRSPQCSSMHSPLRGRREGREDDLSSMGSCCPHPSERAWPQIPRWAPVSCLPKPRRAGLPPAPCARAAGPVLRGGAEHRLHGPCLDLMRWVPEPHGSRPCRTAVAG